MMTRSLTTVLILAGILLVLGCATSENYYTSARDFRAINRENEILNFSDDEIRRAFDSTQQISSPYSLCVYEYAYPSWSYKIPAENENIGFILSTLKEIPELNQATPLTRTFLPGRITPRNVRLAAAYYKADLVLLSETDLKVNVEKSVICLFDLIILPAFIVPSTRIDVETRINAYLIDTRSGHVFHSSIWEESESRWLPSTSGHDYVLKQRENLLQKGYREIINELKLEIDELGSSK